MMEPTNQLTLTDAVIRNATLPLGKAQHYLHDDKLPDLALRMRATGGRTWVYLFTKPGVKGTQRKTLGAWPRYNEKAARKAATIAAGEVVKGVDPNETKREVRRQQAAEKQRTTLAILIVEDGPYQTSLTGRQVVNWKPAMSALRRGLKDHAESGVGDLTRRHIMAAVDKIAKTGKRGAAKDLRKHVHTFLEWCVSEGYVDHNVLAGYREPKETRAQRVGRRTKGRALTDDEIIKVWHASGKLGTFGLLTRMCLLGGPRRSEPTMIKWSKHVMEDRITFDAAWTKMGLHHDVPRTHLVDEMFEPAAETGRDAASFFQGRVKALELEAEGGNSQCIRHTPCTVVGNRHTECAGYINVEPLVARAVHDQAAVLAAKLVVGYVNRYAGTAREAFQHPREEPVGGARP